MKKYLFFGICGFIFFLPGVARGEVAPSEIHLIFEDRKITLNFRAQSHLLQRVPRHFVEIGGKKILVDLEGDLLKLNDLFDVETEFHFAISPSNLHDFLKASSILRERDNKTSVEIRLEEDEIVFEGTPHDGFDIDEERLVALLNRAILSGRKYVRVPAEKVFSDVVVHSDLEQRGIKEIIAIGESNFAGSSKARKQNILAGAQKFNGAVVRKGKQFSFNSILGSVEEEEGFVKELVIKGNKTEKELGGGVCQVSTTAFRAAFSGGLPIAQRRNHSYAVPYYKPFGLDAAIYLGALDMRFRNDTPGDILIQTFSEGDNLFFVFYGTRDDRKVVFEGPFLSDYKKAGDAIVYESEDLPYGEIQEISGAHDGFEAEWVRRVKKGEIENTRSFVSVYKPWPARQKMGTKKKF